MKGAVLVIAMFTLGTAFAPPARAHDGSAESTMAFADHLFDAGDYYRAITEYERVLFHHPDAPDAPRARFRIAMSYYRGGKFQVAARRFRDVAARYPGDEIGTQAAFMVAEAHYGDGDFQAAIAALTAFLEKRPAGPEAERALVLLGRCHLREGNWEKAAQAFERVPPQSASGEAAAGLAAGARRYPELRLKSPALAGTLSAVLPGAGQLYVGRKSDAAVAFLLNAAFVWAAVEAFGKGNDVAGGILLAFEAGWYSGNVFNAVGGAHKHNRRVRQQYLDDLQNRYGRPGDGARGALFVRALAIRF